MKQEEVRTTNGYPRYEWWNEMRRKVSPEYQLVPLTEAQEAQIHRNKLRFLLELIEGKVPQTVCLRESVHA